MEAIDEKVDAVDLLEEFWFFDNLLKRRTTMVRCHSDPCTSSNFNQFEGSTSSSSTEKLPEVGVVRSNKLIRAPSLPPCIGRKEENNVQEKERNNGRSKLTRQSSHQGLLQAAKPSCVAKKEVTQEQRSSAATRNKVMNTGQSSRRNLLRTPSLPPDFGRSEDIYQDKESDARMSRLIQQAFANSSDFLQNQHSSKGMTRTYDIPRYRPPRNLDLESHNNTTGIKEMNRRYSLNQGKMRKSLSALESEEVQGFKDLGFTFDKKNLTPSVADILPGLQEKKKEELDEEDNKMRKPYLSEAWLVQSCAPPPVPNWVSKNSAEDMKTQIKFWAKTVASNVRVQEC
ncbi:uncharacterized protein LOC116111142 [Pistacia vera]|uniref:uncharacterized protein LOC116111142 n=1 Tax=Pistacia vera TaxID=55513 RepID=UPI0012633560|nr:uncharacterized protein LOC116111142 [Pistacia vera]